MVIKSILQPLHLDPSHAYEQTAWMDILYGIGTINKGTQLVIIQRKRFLCSSVPFCLIALWILSNIFSHFQFVFSREDCEYNGMHVLFWKCASMSQQGVPSDLKTVCVYIIYSCAASICGVSGNRNLFFTWTLRNRYYYDFSLIIFISNRWAFCLSNL